MNNKQHAINGYGCKRQRGAIVVLVAIFLIIITAFLALSIDLGYLFVGRNELQNSADAAALGGARKLGKIYQAMGGNIFGYNVDNADGDKVAIIDIAKNVATQNKAAKESIIIKTEDIQIGYWDPDADPKFTETDDKPNAVRVTARRDSGNVSGEIATFFAGAFGFGSAPVSAVATAALSGQGSVTEGELELPIGIDEDWFAGKSDICGDLIQFSPTNESCAGWTSFDAVASDENLRDILLPEDHRDHAENPPSQLYESYNFVGGDLSAGTFEYLLHEYWVKGEDVNKVYDPRYRDPDDDLYNPDYDLPVPLGDDDTPVPLCQNEYFDEEGKKQYSIEVCEDPASEDRLRYPCPNPKSAFGCTDNSDPSYERNAHEWETSVLVYESSGCDNPNQSRKIVGFVPITVFNVGFPSFKVVQGRIECDRVSDQDTRGGGGDFGIWGTIPGLVQ